METGFRHGFIIERSPADANDFVEIARLLPFNDEAWDATMEEAEGRPLICWIWLVASCRRHLPKAAVLLTLKQA